ncbi:MAG: transglutaminase N-terminal domain-containing protein [Spirulinaceae cyanobacterium]
MRYQICHKTIYTYSQFVNLRPHLLRLQPRCDSGQKLHQFDYEITPQPARSCSFIDFDGNNITQIYFEQPTKTLQITAQSSVETQQTNPFNFLLEPWAVSLPIDYPSSIVSQLHPYLQPLGGGFDPEVRQLARNLWQDTQGDGVAFLMSLNQYIYKNCDYKIRETGDPWSGGITLTQKQGSCRDFAVLLMEACRSIGLGARFVSGYEEGDTHQTRRDLHAWVEVYLPGGGWRGFDPTQGLVVSDRHIALVASAFPKQTAPVSGHFTAVQASSEASQPTPVQMHLETYLNIDRLDS